MPVRTKSLVWTVFLIFLGLVLLVALIAWFAGDTLLPMEYEGFD